LMSVLVSAMLSVVRLLCNVVLVLALVCILSAVVLMALVVMLVVAVLLCCVVYVVISNGDDVCVGIGVVDVVVAALWC